MSFALGRALFLLEVYRGLHSDTALPPLCSIILVA